MCNVDSINNPNDFIYILIPKNFHMYNRTSIKCDNMTQGIVNLFSVEHKENTILTKNKHNTLVEHNINKGVINAQV